ncbi:unnamed protein product [Penicillium salamii]|uniref:Putative gamma-glutamylcyclotransferase n=1 Tax=Penicillium salamii TaxID=1612424 RepID=A0A9W4NA55_9EURO|nr:unnamed protein product [Penicillium salamii]
MGDHVLFFYGTLMAPQVLHNVIHGSANPEPWQKAMINIQPAILRGYRRHCVRNADYPAIVPVEKFDENGTISETTSNSRTSVLGTLVSGLTDGDIYRLDMFEGSEYAKTKVVVHKSKNPDGDYRDLSKGLPHMPDTARVDTSEGEEVLAVTYVWILGRELLEEAEWDFETFKKDKIAWWASATESEW